MKELECGCTLNLSALPTETLIDGYGSKTKAYYCPNHQKYVKVK